MLALRNQIARIPEFTNTKHKHASKAFSAFAIASLLSGVNWYLQNQFLYNKNEAENDLIKRVAND